MFLLEEFGDLRKTILLSDTHPIQSEIVFYCVKCQRGVKEKCLVTHFTSQKSSGAVYCKHKTLELL